MRLLILASCIANHPSDSAAFTEGASPIDLIGWNADVVVENSADGVSSGFDGGGSRWFEEGFGGNQDGLPHSGVMTSQRDPNIKFRLQPYRDSNCLRLSRDTEPNQATLVLKNPSRFANLFILAAGTGGSDVGRLAFGFTDGSRSPELDYLAFDWFAGTNGFTGETRFAVQGFGRLEPSPEGLIHQSYDAGFGMHQTDLDLTSLKLTAKPIERITFYSPTGRARHNSPGYSPSVECQSVTALRLRRISSAGGRVTVT